MVLVDEKLPTLAQTRLTSASKLTMMRDCAKSFKLDKDLFFGTVGSFARGEATAESDLDFFVGYRDGKASEADDALKTLRAELLRLAGKAPSPTGAFGETQRLEEMLENIGGDDDSNSKITRRVLLLLEGDWIAGEQLFVELRNNLVGRYVRGNISSHQLCLFLLNDIIRYYRTICVDFDFKTVQNSKPWGIRNIKLIFSRKLIYFSGVILVAETYQRSYQEKLRILKEGFAKSSTQRLLDICGEAALPALMLYDGFLKALDDPSIRAQLEATTEKSRNDNEVFRALKDSGHHFSLKLMNLLHQTFWLGHPIHRALVL